VLVVAGVNVVVVADSVGAVVSGTALVVVTGVVVVDATGELVELGLTAAAVAEVDRVWWSWRAVASRSAYRRFGRTRSSTGSADGPRCCRRRSVRWR
jgi:hypothetical protein